MPEQQAIPKPEIFAIDPADMAVRRSAQRLAEAVYSDPDSFIGALTTAENTPEIKKAGSMIQKLLDTHTIQDMYFDEASESAIAKDSTHQSLLNQRKQMAQATTNVGKMSESARDRRESVAERLREQTIKNRCAVFAGRVLTWQAMGSAQPNGDPGAARSKLRRVV